MQQPTTGTLKVGEKNSVIKRNNSSREDKNIRFYLLNLFFGNDCTLRVKKGHKDCYSVPSPPPRLLPDTITSGFCFTGILPISPNASVFYSFALPPLEIFPLGLYSSIRTDNSPLSRSAWSLCRVRKGGTHHLWGT